MHDVTIVMTAWNRRPERFDYFRQAVEGLERNLQDCPGPPSDGIRGLYFTRSTSM